MRDYRQPTTGFIDSSSSEGIMNHAYKYGQFRDRIAHQPDEIRNLLTAENSLQRMGGRLLAHAYDGIIDGSLRLADSPRFSLRLAGVASVVGVAFIIGEHKKGNS